MYEEKYVELVEETMRRVRIGYVGGKYKVKDDLSDECVRVG